jgi:aconitate hydratase
VPPAETIQAEVLLRLGDDITTDHIMPAGAKVLPLRSNIPAISEHVFVRVDPTFPERAKSAASRGGGIVVGGSNYGQGSSREHAAIAPMYLGLKAVIARSFARIHRSNLINWAILPLVFADPADYERVQQGDVLELMGVRNAVASGGEITVHDVTQGFEFQVKHHLTPREAELVLDGGLLNHIKLQRGGN